MPKSNSSKSSGGHPRILIILVILVAIIGALSVAYVLFSKNGYLTQKVASIPKITKPSPDMSRARVLTIYPESDNLMQIVTKDKVIITLNIPKGAIDKKQNIKMIPYYYNEKSEDPSAGVIISPGNLSFKQPVTLMFDLSDSKLRTDAPKNKSEMDSVRVTGSSQVLMIDQNASELIPTLVAREVETSTQLRARILTGGGYVFSVNGKDQKRWAENALSKDKVNSLSILEAATVLMSADVNLDKKNLSKADAAADKILGKNIPPPHEMVAALNVKSLLTGKKSSSNFFELIPKAQAQEGFIPAKPSTPRQVIEFVCKTDGYAVESYVGYAAAAAKYGYADLNEKCMTVARNKAAAQARALLKNPNAKVKQMLDSVKNLQFLGLDDRNSELTDQLYKKIKDIVTKEANKVAYDIDATPLQMTIELQKLQRFAVEDNNTPQLLKERIEKELKESGAPAPTPPPLDYEEKTEYSEEQVLADQAWAVVGIETLKAMGITDFSQEGLKEKFKEITDNAQLLNEAAYEMCKEMGGANCDSQFSQAKNDLEDALDEGYRVAEDIGTVQNSPYEEPDYDDSEGNYYYEEDLTPTPGEGNSEEWGYEDPADEYEDDHEQEEESEELYMMDSQSTEEESGSEDESETENSAEEEVEGASTSNPIQIFIQYVSKVFSN